jgi:phosphomannomutase / phosphoglucomutase
LQGGDDGVFAALFLADLVYRSGSLRSLRESVAPVFATPDLRVPAAALPFGEIARRLRHAFGAAKEITIDGIRLEMPEGSVLARESVTEPIVTMRVEGSSREGLHQLVETCLSLFPEVLDIITAQISQASGL